MSRQPNPPATRTEVRDVRSFSADQWDELWEFGRRYTETTREAFERSLRAKERVALVRRTDTDALVGMGGIAVHRVCHEGRWIQAIFVGNTVFDPAVRGKSLVQWLGFQTYLRARIAHPRDEVWLFYVTFSYKSYVMLARNFRTFWPRHDRETPAWEQRLIERVGAVALGEGWSHEERGPRRSVDRKLKPWVNAISPEMLHDPDIRYFYSRVPGYAEGDQIAVIAPLDVANWVSVATRAAQRTLRKAPIVGRWLSR